MSAIGRFMFWASLIAVVAVPSQLHAQPTPPVPQAGNQEDKIRPNYELGPGDQVVIRAFQVDEISDKPFRIDSEGDINLPVLGKVHAGGLTVDQFEADLLQRLKTLVRNPQVSVTVSQYRSEPIFLQGSFKAPGIYTLQGRRTLLEMVAAGGGLLPDARRTITITRRSEYGKIPLANAVVDPERHVSTVRISIASLRDNINPAEDIQLQPMDVISADRAEMIYVNGEVNKAGGIELGERDSISVTQLIALVGGLGKDADSNKARVLRPILNTSRRAEISVNLNKILAGKAIDLPLFPNDVLYVPRSRHNVALSQVALIAVPMATGLIYVLASKL